MSAEYIGDGVYVQKAGEMVAISTGCHIPTPEQPGREPDARVYFEPEVLQDFLAWLIKQNKSDLDRLHAKVSHGCTDATCPECDG